MRKFVWPAQRADIQKFFDRTETEDSAVGQAVDEILNAVRRRGDAAIAAYTRKFDGASLEPSEFWVPPAKLREAWNATPLPLRRALKNAKRRIQAFHKTQILKSWTIREPGFGRIDQRVMPLERVGVYAPGGKAAYPSTVLMDVIPAQVAGVSEIILITPPQAEGWPDQRTLAAAHLAGVTRVLRLGGAQAIAALAFGTQTLPRVDKIIGPGNIYVATAKQKLYGRIDIDAIAGPSEVLIIADENTPLKLIAADMLAQAEHDEGASAGAIIVGAGHQQVSALESEIEIQLRALPRRRIARASIRNRGYLISVSSPQDSIDIANLKAPEHLEIMYGSVTQSRAIAERVRNAGAIFIGRWTPEAVGDYIAGPNHTLPTAGTARFFSPLSVWAFYKTSHMIEASRDGFASLADDIITLDEAEGLSGHAETVRKRIGDVAPYASGSNSLRRRSSRSH